MSRPQHAFIQQTRSGKGWSYGCGVCHYHLGHLSYQQYTFPEAAQALLDHVATPRHLSELETRRLVDAVGKAMEEAS